jgi:hypothetical protein
MATKKQAVINLNSTKWNEALTEIYDGLSSAKFPKKILRHAIRLFRFPTKAGRIKYSSTRGASVTAAIEPSDRLRKLVAAIRAVKV